MSIINKIKNKNVVVGVVGLGYVGLPLLLRFNEVGVKVIGFDIDSNKVKMLNNGQSYIEHINGNEIKKAVDNGIFEPTTDFQRISEVDAIILCVPTPLNKYREPDLSYVIDTTESILPYLRNNQILSLESTTYPGTTEEELKPRIESMGFIIGENFNLIYSPEREDPGNKNFTTKDIPKVCGGVTDTCLNIGVALYELIINKVVPVSSCKAAEMTKLLENIHRAVNIGLVNEMKVVADAMGIDIFEVIDAAATKPFGFVPYYPGPGLGGHCIPIDPFYLTWKAREFGLHTRFIELSGEVNNKMPSYVIKKTSKALNLKGKPLNGAKILVAGIAYKKNVDDVRESPSVLLMEKLREEGAVVSYSDPHVARFPKMRAHSFDLESIDITIDNLKEFDCIIIATNHDRFNYDLILENSSMIIDTRGVYRGKFSNVFKA